ncbi:MAG: SPFH domain-containing protein [Gammaproteobacteria bacterium]
MATHQQDSVPPAAPSTSASRRRPLGFSIALAGFVLGAILWSFLSVYTVATDEYAVVTAFGNPVTVNASPGLKFKLPYQSVIKFDRRLNILTPGIGEYLTLEKTPVVASATILWRIAEPRQFLRTVFAKAGAESRLADMLSSQLGAAIGREPLGAFVSTDPAAYRADAVIAAVAAGCRDIALRDYGIDVVDVQLQRLDFPERNRLKCVRADEIGTDAHQHAIPCRR